MSYITRQMVASALSVIENPETNAESRALAVSILKAYFLPPEDAPIEVQLQPLPVPTAPSEGSVCGQSTAKWRSYCEPTVHGEVVIATKRTAKAGRFQPTQAERDLNIRMDKSQAFPALLYAGVRYLSPNSLTFARRAVDSQKLYVERDGVWKSLFQLANGG